jgi:hypothetical protein
MWVRRVWDVPEARGHAGTLNHSSGVRLSSCLTSLLRSCGIQACSYGGTKQSGGSQRKGCGAHVHGCNTKTAVTRHQCTRCFHVKFVPILIYPSTITRDAANEYSPKLQSQESGTELKSLGCNYATNMPQILELQPQNGFLLLQFWWGLDSGCVQDK